MFYTVTLFFLTLLFLFWDCKKPKNFPPGPRWYPIVGCAPQIAQLRKKHGLFCKAIKELANEFPSPTGVYGVKLGEERIVFAFQNKAIMEMCYNTDLDGRPNSFLFRTRTFGRKIGLLGTDEEFWMEQRRFTMLHLKDFGFTPRGIAVNIKEEAQYLVDDIRKRIVANGGQNFTIEMTNLFSVFVLNGLWRIMTGKRYDRTSETVMNLLDMFHELLKNVDMVGATFSQFPWLRYLAPDLSGYKGFVESHNKFYDFLRKEVEEHKRLLNLNEPPTNLMDAYLLEIAKPDHSSTFSDEQLMSVCLDLFIAGTETTKNTLNFIFLYILRDPDIQTRAQAEIDSAVGRERQVSWEDRADLPFCEAITYEGLRFFIGQTLAIPHRALKDTKLCGYDIPKDTMLVFCVYGYLMNPKKFPDPQRFLPDRYLVDGTLKVPSFTTFGYGRRRCIGEMLAKQTLFLFVTTLLQNFNFRVPYGYPIPDDTPIDGLTATIQSFSAYVSPR